MSSPSRSLDARLFGPFVVRIDGEPIPRLHTRKGQWLFALLALRPGRDLERSWLAGTLWPDSREDQARANLRISLTDLRRALGPEARRLTTPTTRTLRLDLSGASVDLIAFDEAVRRGDPASLEEAVSLYRGPFLEGCLEDWVVQERSTRKSACLAALEALAAGATARGDAATAVLHLRRVVAEDPLRETAWRSLMEALAAQGNYGEVTQVYRQFREMLHRELQAEPAPETTRLMRTVRAEARRQAQAKPPKTLPSSAPSPRRLPHPPTPFLGREREIEAVEACLAASRLVTLTGIGGVGKTRLAIAMADAVADDFRDGAWFVDLTGLSDPAFLANSVAQAMGLKEQVDRTIAQTLADYLHRKNLLLILDNCEHLLPSCGRLAASLLESAPGLKILAASREALHVRGEQEYAVPPLALPDPERLPPLERLSQYDAVRLFIDRACEVSSGFSVTNESAPAVAGICQWLEGLPLAIELAASRTRLLSPADLLARLVHRLTLLTGGARDLPARHQTLRGTIDWSYDLLKEGERTLLARLSVFAGGATVEAAEAVCNGNGGIDVLDGLQSLMGKSLLRRVESPGEDRFGMFEMIREYASERLVVSGEEEALGAAHTAYFLALAESAEARMFGRDQKIGLERAEAERDNFEAALQRCIGREKDPETGLKLVGALQRFWSVRGRNTESRAWSERALAATSEATLDRAKVLCGAGSLAKGQGDHQTARVRADESLRIGRDADDPRTIADALHVLGDIALALDLPAAAPLYEEELALHRQMNHRWGIASTLGRLVLAAMEKGELESVIPRLQESLTIAREVGDQELVGRLLLIQARLALSRGESEEGIARLYETCAGAEEIGERWTLAMALMALGGMSIAEGKPELQRPRWREALSIFRELKDRGFTTYTLFLLADAEGGERGTRLLGAVETACEESGGLFLRGGREHFELAMEGCRSALGEGRFAAAWAKGRAMALDEAVDYALTDLP